MEERKRQCFRLFDWKKKNRFQWIRESEWWGVRSLSPFCFYFCRHIWWPRTLCLSATREISLQSPDVALTDTRPCSKAAKPRQNARERLIPLSGQLKPSGDKTWASRSRNRTTLGRENPTLALCVYVSTCFLLMFYSQTVESFSICLPAPRWLTGIWVTAVYSHFSSGTVEPGAGIWTRRGIIYRRIHGGSEGNVISFCNLAPICGILAQ